jgi:hypothetical protein
MDDTKYLDENKVLFEIDGEEYCNDEKALALMLLDDVLFCNSRYYSMEKDGKSEGHTIVLFIICNDIFAWGCADAEELNDTDEISKLYKMWLKDKKWGATKYCCFKRNEKPQHPIAEAMKKDGSWDDEMEKLPLNCYDEYCRKEREKKKNE